MPCCNNPVKAIFKSCAVVVYWCHSESALWEDRLLTDSRDVRLLLCAKVLEVWSNRKLHSFCIHMGLTLKYRSCGLLFVFLSMSRPDQTQSVSVSPDSLHLQCNNLSFLSSCFSTFKPLIPDIAASSLLLHVCAWEGERTGNCQWQSAHDWDCHESSLESEPEWAEI